jgi:hypothetical protein
MKLQNNGYPLPISKEFIQILEDLSKTSGKDEALHINFRDITYSPKNGGFHPVEVMISENGVIQYITDFAYTGYPAELVKEIDFDFSAGVLQHFGNKYHIGYSHTLFNIWQLNFCSYYNMGVYTVTVKEVL